MEEWIYKQQTVIKCNFGGKSTNNLGILAFVCI